MINPDTQPKALTLDTTALGEALIKYVLISAQLGHQHVADTLRDYWHGDGLPAEDHFIHDLFTENAETIERRWFGDQLPATLAAWLRAIDARVSPSPAPGRTP